MQYLGHMNGWKQSPQHWWRYLLLPIGWEVIPACWTRINIFGFAVIVETDKQRRDRAAAMREKLAGNMGASHD